MTAKEICATKQMKILQPSVGANALFSEHRKHAGQHFRSSLYDIARCGCAMSGGRKIFAAPVRHARHTERISISSPGDFQLGAKTAVARVPEIVLPYCLDFLRRRSVYVGGVDPKGAQEAPFYYLHLRREARSVVSVPWESGPLAAQTTRAPVFLFSPGRCGSTLLSAILSAAGLPNVSEPDFYTQATTALGASRFNPLRPAIQKAVWAMGADLAAALDPAQPPLVKLRAESCRAPDLLWQPLERRTLFMTRGFESWARSTGRAFRNGPDKAVRKYLRAMTCYAWLRQYSDCHLLHYEDLLAAPVDTMAALARFLGRDIGADAVTSTMKEDSQEGTPLRQGARADQPGWEKRFDATMALWNSDRVRGVRGRLGVDELRTG
jgi:hypothetical protein